MWSYRRGEFYCAGVHGPDDILDDIHFALLEVGLSALIANPCRHVIQYDMATLAIDVEGSVALAHFALTVHALHDCALSSHLDTADQM